MKELTLNGSPRIFDLITNIMSNHLKNNKSADSLDFLYPHINSEIISKFCDCQIQKYGQNVGVYAI